MSALEEEVVAEVTLASLIDQAMMMKKAESAFTKQAAELKKERDVVEKDIINMMQAQGIERTGTLRANVIIQHKRFPQVKDWDAFHTFVYENHAAHLLQRRVSTTAVAEYEAEGEVLPGIEFYEEDQLNLTSR